MCVLEHTPRIVSKWLHATKNAAGRLPDPDTVFSSPEVKAGVAPSPHIQRAIDDSDTNQHDTLHLH